MRHLLFRSLAALACFGVFSLAQTSAAPKPDQSEQPDFNGTWTLDLKASDSLEPIMKKVGAVLLEQKLAAWITLKATVHQTEQVLTVATRGLGFALDRTLYLDGRTDPSNKQLFGATAQKTRTAWSEDQTQLVETHQIKTRQGKEGELIIKRYLINDGKSSGACFHRKAQRRTTDHLCPRNLAQATLGLVTGVVASQKSSTGLRFQ